MATKQTSFTLECLDPQRVDYMQIARKGYNETSQS